MSSWKTLWLVATREWKSRRKAFIITTSLLIVLVAGGLVAIGLATDDEGAYSLVSYRVGAVDAPPGLEWRINEFTPPGYRVDVRYYASVAQVEAAMMNGDLEFGIVGTTEILSYPGRSAAMIEAIAAGLADQQTRERASEYGLSAADLATLFEADVAVRQVVEPAETSEADSALAAASLFFTFMGILAYGQWVAYGVVEEKGGRVAEVVLSAVRPGQLLVAKIVSIGLLGLSQLVIVALLVATLGGWLDVVDLPDATGGAVAIIIMWFLLGYSFYAAGYAASGALVRSARDASDAVGGFNLLLMAGYLIAVVGLTAERDTGLLQVASFAPPTAPLTMPMRMVRGDVGAMAGVLSVLVMLLAIVAMVRLGAAVFRTGIIRVGKKMKWREALRTMR